MSDRTEGDPHAEGRATAAVDPAVRAGVALFNEGFYLAAHEPWETTWLPLDAGKDERLLHGLIQFAAATHHARTGNDSGAIGTAEGAIGYLDGFGDRYRGLELEPIRSWCRLIAADPDDAAAADPPTLRIDDRPVGFEDLGPGATLAALPAAAEATGIGDEEVMEAVGEFVRSEESIGADPLVELAFAYLREPDARPQIAARIADRVERRQRERDDVAGVF
ncbi:DUF309 domain-containing protein [Halorubrum vacuolatum]|uniref:DUF309 domain-containing protein n=1 Tax=Halorubrum vacuolatum TaxID=63740 RepID=A0A238VM41_HALVU|nr:DUF309 domain-containing protein [Halorubrum vacuolatum]SNR35452.1 protein of unknown function [Halorubrum vacuolatum]